MVRRVAADLAQRPHSGGLDVVLLFVDKSVLQRANALADDDGQRHCLGESGDVAERHDARQPHRRRRLAHKVDERGRAARVDHELGQLGRVLYDLAHAGGGVLAHIDVEVLEARQHAREDLGLDDDLGKVDAVLGHLRQRAADLALELTVVV